MWIKKEFKLLGKDEAGELTVSNDEFHYTGSVNPTISKEVEEFVATAKQLFEDYQTKVAVKQTADGLVDSIINELNK